MVFAFRNIASSELLMKVNIGLSPRFLKKLTKCSHFKEIIDTSKL